ncbi:MAG TPA: hypothetical protein VLF68_03730 [Candidatus Saccharimonadales bacterium]|nr:hypothetical protein [Candidatus Saccharimonadales bacterium]
MAEGSPKQFGEILGDILTELGVSEERIAQLKNASDSPAVSNAGETQQNWVTVVPNRFVITGNRTPNVSYSVQVRVPGSYSPEDLQALREGLGVVIRGATKGFFDRRKQIGKIFDAHNLPPAKS